MKYAIVFSCIVVVSAHSTAAQATDIFLRCTSKNIKSQQTQVNNLEVTDGAVYLDGSKLSDQVTISSVAIEYRNDLGTTSTITKINRTNGEFTDTFIHHDKGTIETTWFGSCEVMSSPQRKF